MVRNYLTNFVKIDISFSFFLAAFILLVPLRLAMAWLLAVCMHELCHYLALRLCRVQLYSIRLHHFGVIMEIGSMTKAQELLTALAGPIGGGLLLFVSRWLPYTAICALVHSVYNLLPTFPSDGGRALRCILIKVFGESEGICLSKWVHYITIFLICSLALFTTFMLRINLLPLFVIEVVSFLFMNRKLPCKHELLIVQ